MKLFVKIEFSKYENCNPVSIGISSEDGKHQLYLQSQECEHVEPNQETGKPLNKNALKTGTNLAEQLYSWINNRPERLQILYDGQNTYRTLENIFEGKWPENIAGLVDIRPLIDTGIFDAAIITYHTTGKTWFNSLHGAISHSKAWKNIFHHNPIPNILNK